jgi:hypothetical protein
MKCIDLICHNLSVANQLQLGNLATKAGCFVGDMRVKAEDYFQYLDRQHDDAPLYLFDKSFCEHSPQLCSDYATPEPFQEDLFSVLADKRPDYRWLTIGPARSGSTFHVDPNGTSAWNACICGRKLWCAHIRV